MTDHIPKKQKILYMVTQAGENTELALLPFMHAVAALSMEVEAVVVLMANSIWLAKKDYAKHIRYPDKPPLDELIQNFLDLGGKLLLCNPCAKARLIEASDFIEGSELIAAARFTDEALSSNATLCY